MFQLKRAQKPIRQQVAKSLYLKNSTMLMFLKKWLIETGPATVKNTLKEWLKLNACSLRLPGIFCLSETNHIVTLAFQLLAQCNSWLVTICAIKEVELHLMAKWNRQCLLILCQFSITFMRSMSTAQIIPFFFLHSCTHCLMAHAAWRNTAANRFLYQLDELWQPCSECRSHTPRNGMRWNG